MMTQLWVTFECLNKFIRQTVRIQRAESYAFYAVNVGNAVYQFKKRNVIVIRCFNACENNFGNSCRGKTPYLIDYVIGFARDRASPEIWNYAI